jgi:NAD(P)H-dependent FMN reductase
VILGTTRADRFSERVYEWVVRELSAHSHVEVERIDLRDYPLPFFDGRPPAYTLREYASDVVAGFGEAVDRSDGFLILTGEYNHGYPAVLKNAFDSTFVEWRRKPVAFVGWGNVGGARAIEQLRQVAVEFEMAPLRHAVHILPDVMRNARGTERGHTDVFVGLEPKLELLVDDLMWWCSALALARSRPLGEF